MSINVHKLVLCITDFDDVGADEIPSVLEEAHYPNHCISPRVVSIQSQSVEWDDDHPLNNRETAAAEFERMFSPRLGGPELEALLQRACANTGITSSLPGDTLAELARLINAERGTG